MFKIIIILILIWIVFSKLNNKKNNNKGEKSYSYKEPKTNVNLEKEEKIDKKKEEFPEIEVVFFDTETNGLKANNSVLSISAIKTLVDFSNKTIDILDRYERFYFPEEPYNYDAIRVNGLTKDYITKKRNEADYPVYFNKDQIAFFQFCGNIQHFVAHNIEFDRKFLNKRLPKQFCTMKSNTDIIKLPPQRVGTRYKWPKLEEATRFYRIPSNNSRFHDSMYDVEMTIEVFKAMLKNEKGNKLIKEFLFNPTYSYREYYN